MDTSETYIKMSDHPKIQEQAQYEDFDYFVYAQTKELRYAYLGDYDYIKNMNLLHKEREYIWLPRQDQIQEMLIYHGASDRGALVIDVVIRFYDWIRNTDYMAGEVDFIEQLWLAFYMHEKHKLIWENNKWKKEKKEKKEQRQEK